MVTDSLRRLLVAHEGYRLKPYADTVGKITIGVGHNLSDNGIYPEDAERFLERDVLNAQNDLRLVFSLDEQSAWTENRRNALTDMMFNLGAGRFSGFHDMISAVHAGDWRGGAAAMRDSAWARQLPGRVDELSAMVEGG